MGLLAVTLFAVPSASAQQGLELSVHADFSTNDRLFAESDVMYIRVTPGTELDLTAVSESRFELDPISAGERFEGILGIQSDGTFTGSIDVSDLEGDSPVWMLHVEIEDLLGHEYEARTAIVTRERAGESEPFRVRGTVEEVSLTTITVARQQFALTAETEIRAEGELGVVPGDIVGRRVIVEAAHSADGGLPSALTITVVEDDDAEEVEVEGMITALSDLSITVEGIEFLVDTDTRIEVDGHGEIGFDALHTGLLVEVEGELETDGSVRAKRISVDDEDDPDELVIRGEIREIEDAAITIDETTFLVTQSTRIDGEHGARLTLEDVEIGMFARARLQEWSDGSLTAVRLMVEHLFEVEDVRIAGRVENATSSSVTVHGITFAITSDTDIQDVHGNAVDASELQAGQSVRVEGERTGSGFVAGSIDVNIRVHQEGGFGGVVTAVSGGEIEINGAIFTVTDETIVEGAASVGAIRVGDRVRLRYRVLGDGSRLALRIRLNASLEAETEISGIITEIDDASVVVADVQVLFTLASKVFDELGVQISASSLAEGQTITVRGTRWPPDGSGVVADQVHVQHVAVVSGSVESSASDRIVVADRSIGLTGETLIVGRGNAALSAEALKAGTFVEIIAVGSADGGSPSMDSEEQMNAERILVLQKSEATSAEDGDVSMPEAFTLGQNYPNPFNPSTTIAFEVADAAGRNVTLTVFDVLGRKVRTLVDASLSPGAYSYTWNGNDDAGRPVASGVYLYRLEVGRYASTRSMTLIK